MPTAHMIVGPAATGKSDLTKSLVEKNCVRLNRDTEGGHVLDLLPKFESLLSNGRDVVLDNTHLTPDKRIPFVEAAKRHGAKVKCIVMDTKIEDAQANAIHRMIDLKVNVLDPEEIKKSDNPNVFLPTVLFQHYKMMVPPKMEEGFESIETYHFERDDRYRGIFTNKAFIFDYDGTLRKTKSGEKYPRSVDDIEILPGRKEKLYAIANESAVDGILVRSNALFGASNQSGVAKNDPPYAVALECFEETNRLLDRFIQYAFCPHAAGPINCWCRKPMAGMPIFIMREFGLRPENATMIGDMTSDKTCAARAGIAYVDAEEFFK